MASIIDVVQQHLGPQEIAQIGQQLGTDPAATQQAVNAALPALVGGMASTARQPQGATEIHGLMGSHSGALGDIGSMISGGGAGGGILGSILGHHQPDVEQGVQQASGLSSEKTKKLLMILAPIVLSALARRTMGNDGSGAAATPGATAGGGGLGGILSGGLGGILGGAGGGLGDILKQDATQAQQQTQGGPVGGVLGKILGGLGG
jgi:hypothetical protein